MKDRDVEELVDYYWHRRLAFPVAKLAYALRLTPTQLTMVALLLGIVAGVSCGLTPTYGSGMSVLGGALLLLSVVFDCADGMLARLQGGGTRFGMLLDGFCDWIVGLSFFSGLAYSISSQLTQWWVWPALLSTLVSLGVQATLYDTYKNSFVVGTTGQINDDKESDDDGWLARVFAGFYRVFYATAQKKIRASMVPVSTDAFRVGMRGPMRAASWLGLGFALFAMYGSALLVPWLAAMPLVVGVAGFVIGRNVLAVIVGRRWKAGLATLRQAAHPVD